MSNLARMYFSDAAGARTELRVAKYRLPLLWLACFEPGDVVSSTDADEAPEVTLSTTPDRALALVTRRRPFLGALITNLDEYLPGWSAFLAALGPGRVVVDATEVLLMRSDAELAAPLRTALPALDEPLAEATLTLLELSSLGEHLDPVTRIVSDSRPKRVADVAPAFAALPGGDSLLPSEPAIEALTGIPLTRRPDASPGPAPAPGKGPREEPPVTTREWTTGRTLALLCGVAFVVFLATVVRSGNAPTPFGWAALAWASSSALLLWTGHRAGRWVFVAAPADLAAQVSYRRVAGDGGGSMLELAGYLAMLTAWPQLRPAPPPKPRAPNG